MNNKYMIIEENKNEKIFILGNSIVICILALVTLLLVKYEFIPLPYEFPILISIFTLGVLITIPVDKFYLKNNCSK